MADDEERLKTLLASQTFTAALREAFDIHQAEDVECTHDKLWVNTKPVSFGEIQQLRTLMESNILTGAISAEQAQDIRNKFEARFNAGSGLQPGADEQTFAGQAARIAQAVEKLDAPAYQQNASSFPLSRAAFLYQMIHAAFLMLWLGLLMAIFGKTSWFPQVYGSFMLSGIVGLALLTGFTVREADIDLDQAAPDIKTLSLQSKHCSLHCTTGGKHAQTSAYNLSDQACSGQSVAATIALYKRDDYHCEHSARIDYDLLFPWPTEMPKRRKQMYKLEGNVESYDQAQVGQSYAFPIHEGYLELAWIRKNEIRAE